MRNAIGINPDSKGFICVAVKLSEPKVTTRGYMPTDSDLKSFLRWVKGKGDAIVAIEGSNLRLNGYPKNTLITFQQALVCI